jgi:hypothetical protein
MYRELETRRKRRGKKKPPISKSLKHLFSPRLHLRDLHPIKNKILRSPMTSIHRPRIPSQTAVTNSSPKSPAVKDPMEDIYSTDVAYHADSRDQQE